MFSGSTAKHPAEAGGAEAMPAAPIAAVARAVVSSPLLNFMTNDKTLPRELPAETEQRHRCRAAVHPGNLG